MRTAAVLRVADCVAHPRLAHHTTGKDTDVCPEGVGHRHLACGAGGPLACRPLAVQRRKIR
jgi:hypothetical protein